MRSSMQFMSSLFEEALIKIASEEYEFSCVMAYLPKDISEKIFAFSLKIPDKKLYDPKTEKHFYGRENEPHLTVKFGMLTENPEEIKKILKNLGKAKVTLKEMSIFDSEEKYDVLKINVKSPQIEKANKIIAENVKCSEKYSNFEPHAPIAYLKKGIGGWEKYKEKFNGIQVVFDQFVFQDKKGNRTIIPL